MAARLASGRNPNFLLLTYNRESSEVTSLMVIPKQFFVLEIIEQRRPLAPTARRAGWVGCNILLEKIPISGRIALIEDRIMRSKPEVLANWQRVLFLRGTANAAARGWLLSVMHCIERIGQQTFRLDQIYSFEGELRTAYPANQHVKEKIRQQLQALRDLGYLHFVGRGRYHLNASFSPRMRP